MFGHPTFPGAGLGDLILLTLHTVERFTGTCQDRGRMSNRLLIYSFPVTFEISESLRSPPFPEAGIVGVVAVHCRQHSEEERLELQYSMERGMWYRAFTAPALYLFLHNCVCKADWLYRSWANPWELREQTLWYSIHDFARGLHL